MLNKRNIFKILGILLAGEAIALIAPLLVAIYYGESDIEAFVKSILIVAAVASVLIFIGRNAAKKMEKRDGFIVVSLVWVVYSIFGALPFTLSGEIPLFTDAFFETMSGFTTTGSSVLNNIESLPHGILFWRSMTQWLGGMGIIVLSLAILPFLGVGGMELFVAEVPGPTPDKLSPRISVTARTLWGIYIGFTVVEAILLKIGGMSLFDSVCHSFTTMATGGYSTKQASVEYWSSPFIQYVITLFMFIAGTNFTVSYYAIAGKFSKVKKNEEFKWYAIFTILFTLVITVGLLVMQGGSQAALNLTGFDWVEQTFRDVLFQVVSIITTTGFATCDYLLWTPFLYMLLFMLFFFGGSAGSTGGGIKIMRILLLFKNSLFEFKRLLHPKAIIPVRYEGRSVAEQTIFNILAFFMIYVIIFAASVVIFMIVEPDFASAVGAVATSLGNIGPGLGHHGPAENFSDVSCFGKWFLSFLMLIGRLELFTVLLLFTPVFWKR